MKTNNRRVWLGMMAAVAALGLSACNTFQSRARERSATYEALDPATQQRLQGGKIDIGDTPDMVYIALGHPDTKRVVTTADGQQETWVYRTYWQEYEGSAWMGYRRVIVPASNRRGYVVFHEPVRQDIYSTHADDTIRVAFNRGEVASVEQSMRGR
jgi:hypothetical protein